jgi:hypothetical protein
VPDLLAPQVGLEPTTLRLTARILPCSAVLDIALSCLFLCRYSNRFDEAECRDYPEIPTILKECPYKSPYSVRALNCVIEALSTKGSTRLGMHTKPAKLDPQ